MNFTYQNDWVVVESHVVALPSRPLVLSSLVAPPSHRLIVQVGCCCVIFHRAAVSSSCHAALSSFCCPLTCRPLTVLAGNVADMSRHVGDDTTCRSNFGQMGPCRRHKIEDVVAVCVGLSRHLPDFRNSYVEIYYGMGVHTHRYPTLISVMFSFLSCSPHETKITTTLLNTTAKPHTMSNSTIRPCLLQRLWVQ